ncbi:MAG: hypothetical protein ACJ74Z_12595 [Bryobacteraceae bacterium]
MQRDGGSRVVPFKSKVFPVPRSLRILLPAGYYAPVNRDWRYSVLYLNDGQNLFNACTSVYQREEWQVDETVNRLIASGKLPSIIVAG